MQTTLQFLLSEYTTLHSFIQCLLLECNVTSKQYIVLGNLHAYFQYIIAKM